MDLGAGSQKSMAGVNSLLFSWEELAVWGGERVCSHASVLTVMTALGY